METKANHFVVGLFVILAVIAVGAFSIWLAERTDTTEQTFYEIAFPGSLGGLQVGSQVRYRGIPVGAVSDVRIDPENVESVLVTITVRPNTPIKTDTTASVETNPLTGLSTVLLEGGTQASPPLMPQGEETFARIQAVPSPLESVFRSTPELIARAGAMVDRINMALSDDNLAAVSRVLASLDALLGEVASHREKLGALVETTGETVQALGSTAGEVELLAKDLRGVASKLDTVLGETGAAATSGFENLGSASASLEQLATRLDRMAQQVSGPLGDFSRRGLGNAGSLVTELRELVVTLTRIAREFERDPAGYLLGGQRGFTPP